MPRFRIWEREFWRSDEPCLAGLNPRQTLLHYVLIPLLLGFLSGWPQVGRTIAWPKVHALAFWMGMSFSGWWLNDAFCRLVAGPLRRRRVPLGATLLAGALLASFPSDLFLRLWVHGYHAMFPTLPIGRPLPDASLDPAEFLKTHFYGYLAWPAVCLGLFHIARMPLFGYRPEPHAPATARGDAHAAPVGAQAASGLMARLPASARGRILALASEQHYLRVHTDQGEALVLYRLKDAIHELGAQGLQVHRSYWVAHGAVHAVVGSRAAPRLKLVNALEVPVSRSFRNQAEMAGLLDFEAREGKAQGEPGLAAR
ncbi:LytTR family transcriptional regulator DNA-binding domain-containing protein [Novosphingobium profundi]|uniref:LytTR family DNA-binding domain-containing protein n=1 Tax=Novosphingobium profundi TaxID=1774954 RepID=UPI001FEC3146|nr:LytTR family DNA-binding domain-containing protein [Novosphingobium profundi]MBT0667187.1 LytTR family transcriptional regulator DNA-binding domain-containing protein [Novosphingobium profundi]